MIKWISKYELRGETVFTFLKQKASNLYPGYFALVMATGHSQLGHICLEWF